MDTLLQSRLIPLCFFFFFNDTATTEIYTLSLHDALPICEVHCRDLHQPRADGGAYGQPRCDLGPGIWPEEARPGCGALQRSAGSDPRMDQHTDPHDVSAQWIVGAGDVEARERISGGGRVSFGAPQSHWI